MRRLLLVLSAGLFLADNCFSSNAIAGDSIGLRRRDDPPPPSKTPAPAPAATSVVTSSIPPGSAVSSTPPPSGSPSPSPSTPQSSPPASHNSTFGVSTSSRTLTTSLANSTTTAVANSTDPDASGDSADPDALPVTPEVSPALFVAGAFLILSGLPLTLIGIKNKWLQIFISTTYLISLSITVLILYVVNPPVSSAIEGAYLVGAFVPALGLGGLSLIFRDVTEGLGCAVGGFALAMFFLILKPGGLLTTTAAKSIFIGCFTVAIYALSFSRLTRSHALIGATSLGGATAVVLGIDCFSRAGLKEFWVYIWDLNDKFFPLLTNSYPLTRGIRVEIAGIVVLTIFGVLSQMRIWRVIQAQRRKKEEERREKEAREEEIEADVARRLEAGTRADRTRWETEFGDNGDGDDEDGKDGGVKTSVTERRSGNVHPDSGIGTEAASSTRKNSTVSASKDGEVVIEMDRLTNPRTSSVRSSNINNSGPSAMLVRVAEDDTLPAAENNMATKDRRVSSSDWPLPSRPESVQSGKIDGGLPAFENSSPKETIPALAKQVGSKKRTSPTVPGPEIVPLPFVVRSQEDEENSDKSDGASNATFNSSGRDSPGALKRYPAKTKRMSGGSTQVGLLRRLSKNAHRKNQAKEMLRESLVTSSSIEALVDSSAIGSERELDADGEQASEEKNTGEKDRKMEQEGGDNDTTEKKTEEKPDKLGELEINDVGLAALQISFTRSSRSSRRNSGAASGITKDDSDADADDSSNSAHTAATAAAAKKKHPRSLKSRASTTRSRRSSHASSIRSLKNHLPEGASKVVLQYRTNEWAKHLSTAERPEWEDLNVPEVLTPTDIGTPTSIGSGSMPQAWAKESDVKGQATKVNPQELLQTPLTAEPEPAPLSASTIAAVSASKSPPQSEATGGVSGSSSGAAAAPSNPFARLSRNGSALSIHRSASASSASLVATANNNGSSTNPTRSVLRSTSTPIFPEPIDEDQVASFPPPPNPASTLLAQRSSLLMNKTMTGSTAGPARTATMSPPALSPYYLSRSHSVASSIQGGGGHSPGGSAVDLVPGGKAGQAAGGSPDPESSVAATSAAAAAGDGDGDDVPLSARRSYLQRTLSNNNNSSNALNIRQSAASPAPSISPNASATQLVNRATSTPSPPINLPTGRLSAQPSVPDPALRRASMLAAWRSSLALDAARNGGHEREVNARREEHVEEHRAQQQVQVRRSESRASMGWGAIENNNGGGAGGALGPAGGGAYGPAAAAATKREMNDAHREVLRRMQAGANRNLATGRYS